MASPRLGPGLCGTRPRHRLHAGHAGYSGFWECQHGRCWRCIGFQIEGLAFCALREQWQATTFRSACRPESERGLPQVTFESQPDMNMSVRKSSSSFLVLLYTAICIQRALGHSWHDLISSPDWDGSSCQRNYVAAALVVKYPERADTALGAQIAFTGMLSRKDLQERRRAYGCRSIYVSVCQLVCFASI